VTAPVAVGRTGEVARRPRAAWRYAGLLLLLIAVASAVGFAIGEPIDQLTRRGQPFRSTDNALPTWLHDRTCDGAAWLVALGVSELGRPIFLYLLAGIGMIVSWRRREKINIAYFAITGLTGGVVDTIIKVAVGRPRPGLAGCHVGLEGKSFPSGHTMSSTIAYGMLLVVFLRLVRSAGRRRSLVAFVVVILVAIGIARMAVGAHYATDITLGYVFGATWLVLGTWAFRRWRVDSGDPQTAARLRLSQVQREAQQLDAGGR
jgi:undecaprenyl-diphosphatase